MSGITGTARSPQRYAAAFDERVAVTVEEAARRSGGFARRLRAAGIAAQAPASVSDLDRLPVLTKDTLLEQQRHEPPFGGYLADDAHPVRVFQSPGPIYEPQRAGEDPWRWRSALIGSGFTTDDVVLNAFGYHLSPAGVMFDVACQSLGATVLPAGVGNKDLQVQALRDLGVTAYIGPPSYLKALLETVEAAGVEHGVQRAFVTAEPLPPSLRAWLVERVPTVRQGYGTAEAGLLGAECDRTDGFHVPADALVQICDLDSGAARYDGEQGQVVVTLFDTAYPLVRFGTGDLSAWAPTACPCGSPTPRIRGWMGRVGDAVKVKGMFLHPAQVARVMSTLDGVAAYHLVIDRVDHQDVLRCEVVPAGGDGEALADRVRLAMRDGLRFRVEVEVVDAVPEDRPAFDDVRRWE